MIGYIDIINDFVEDPRRAAAEVRDRRPWALGALCFASAGLALYLAQSLSKHFLLLPSGPVALVLSILCEGVAGVLFAGVLHLVAEMGGGKGTAGGLFVLLGLSDLVWTLALPLVFLLKLAGVDNWLSTSVMLFVLGWANLSLKARSLRDNYGLGIGKSWLLLSVPYVVGFLLLLVLLFLAVAGMFLSILRLFQ